ncbi:uncharacterized protein LOC135077725 [Ostrinia nubilalis]|uniref:uncharacterized protein LOC135077725 n=1 Tax=Ostrinia nubilalis TaxID=29057 RepID=UPI003082388E
MSYSQQSDLPPKLQEAIDKIIQNENFKSYHIEVKQLEIDNSFVGSYREINISGESKNGNKELQLFTKTNLDDKINNVDMVANVSNLYKIEAFMYSEFNKTINEVQEEANIPFEERYVLAKSYVSSDENTIIMENLAAKGFTMYPHQRVITLKFAELAIQSLAKFHSFAFILKERRPLFYENKVKNMKQPLLYGTNSFNELVQKCSQYTIDNLNPEHKKKMEIFLPTILEKFQKYTADPADVWCLVHGDFKSGNIMAQFKNGEPCEVRVVDYQFSFYGCSIIELFNFIFTGTDQEFRKNHLEYLKNFYYKSMEEFLKLFNMDVEDYYPRAEFERLYKERLDYGLMIALFFLPIILAKKNENSVADILDSPSNAPVMSDFIRNRISGIVEDFIQWGYI